MSTQSFKVKSGLTLNPTDLSTLTNPQAGDLACDINDSNKIKRYDANAAAWTEVGSGGVGGTDIFFVQDFESASLSTFTQTGLTLSQTDPLHGRVSALLTHQAAINQSFKQVIAVDRKFRGETMTLRLNAKSNASAGNVTINIYDETNAANIVASEQLQLSTDTSGAISRVGFTIPATCASISYTITALPEAGSPVTRIDDIIAELAVTSLLETSVEVPVVTAWQSYTPTFQGFGTGGTGPTNIEFEWRQVGGNVEIRGKFTSGTSTAVEARIGLPAGLTSAGTSVIPSLQITGVSTRSISDAGSFHVLIEPSVTYLTLGRMNATNSGLTKITGSNFLGLSDTASFFASVPCAGLSATSTKTIPLTQSGLIQEADSEFYGAGNAGQTITAGVTRIPFAAQSMLGSAITWDGDTATINEAGIYEISGSTSFTAAGDHRIYIVPSDGNSAFISGISSASGTRLFAHTRHFNVGDSFYILSATTGGTLTNSQSLHHIHICKQGSLKQVAVSSDQKITIPTSELRFEGASARGTGTETAIVQFDSVAKIRGDAFTVNNANGTSITMLKAGKIDISTVVATVAGTRTLQITKNQQTRTALSSTAYEILSESVLNTTANPRIPLAYSGFVNVGDVIRVAADFTPSNSAEVQLNLSFQEQDISVSVTNTLPQFSESDSSIQVSGANGFGSTNTLYRRFSSVVQNIGSDIIYTDSSTDGASFTVMSSGIYHISYSETSTANTNSMDIRIHVDSSLVATDNQVYATASTAQKYASTSFSAYLVAGQVVTARVANAANNNGTYCYFAISKVGKPNVTGVDVTPFVNVPQPESQGSVIDFGAFGIATLTGSPTSSFGSGIYSYNSTTGVYTILKTCKVSASLYGTSNAASEAVIRIYKNGGLRVSGHTNSALGRGDTVSFTELAYPGDVFDFRNDANTFNSGRGFFFAEAASDQILTAPETFSTDTAPLTYANAATYTLSTLANAPVGTYITFTYAANTNTRTQTTLTNRPTQTDADMNTNGILIYTRAYNAASTAAQPACIAIQIGKGLKGKSLDLYKSTGKVNAGSIDTTLPSSTSENGIGFKEYNEATGILIIDSGSKRSTLNTLHNFVFGDDFSVQASGYLVINASKNPALTGFGLNRIAMRATSTAGGSIGTSATLQTFAEEAFDTNGAWNGNTFTAPEDGYYQVNAQVVTAAVTLTTTQPVAISIYVNGNLIQTSATRGNGSSNAYYAQISQLVRLTKNSTVQIYALSGVATTQNTGANLNLVSISKVSV